MTADRDLEHRVADFYASEPSLRAPDRVVTAVLATTGSIPQRRVLLRVPRRFPPMNTYAKLAIAAVVVIAIGALGLNVLRPGPAPGVGGSPRSLQPSISPSADPSAPPPATATFDSTIHGISIAHPDGWVTIPATEPWRSITQLDKGPAMDHIWDPVIQDHLSLNLASLPLDGASGEAWATEFLADPGLSGACSVAPEAITVDGANGLLCASLATAWTDDRGYIIWLYLSDDEPWLPRYYDTAWFRGIVDGVDLRPEDAVDTVPSAVPSPS